VLNVPADLINLNKARKAKARADKEGRAQENRAKFGRTKAAKQRDETVAEFAKQRLAALRLDRPKKGSGHGGSRPAGDESDGNAT
jgi:hypothetical protein